MLTLRNPRSCPIQGHIRGIIVQNFKRKLLTPLLYLATLLILLSAKPPALTPHDTQKKIEEILSVHVQYNSLTPELIKRAVLNYLDELDPNKTYLLKAEIAQWLDPPTPLLAKTISAYQKEDFSLFQEIHDVMLRAIGRRGEIEEKIGKSEPLTNIKASELKDLTWCETEDALCERLKKIRAVQLEAVKKLDKESLETFFKRVERRRLTREKELLGANSKEKKQVILSFTLKAISSALDSQTVYFTPTEASQFLMQMQQRLFGIGAHLRDDFNGLSIVQLLDGGPALLGGQLKVADRIIAVDRQPIIGMEITEAVELIRGKEGTYVQLTVLRPKGEEGEAEEKLDISIRRGEIVLNEARYEVEKETFEDGILGHLSLHSFYQDPTTSSANDLNLAIEALKKENNLKGIILDLRGNGGGLITESVAVTGLFIHPGVVVSVKDHTHRIQRLRNSEKPAWDGPLIVLVNRGSASASEIVAQTLQEYGRAIIVGDPETFGKGTFQTFTLEATRPDRVNPKGEYKVTRGLYYTVSGKSPQLTGVLADVPVPGILDTLEIGERYTKYPLESASIAPAFIDDFSDISPFQRTRYNSLYGKNGQTVLTTYTDHLETLQKNSAKRIANSADYQLFLQKVAQDDFNAEIVDTFVEQDLQYKEALEVLKELVQLTQKSPEQIER